MSVTLEFDHCMGLNALSGAAHFHPNGSNYVYSAGGNVVIGDLVNQHSQAFLSRHDDLVTALTVSPSGRYLASGQQGDNSNVYVWDFESRQVVYCFEEHDYLIQAISFSHDEKLLATLGGGEDRKLIIWDMSNGYIVASSDKLPAGSLCLKHGGFVKDIKRRDTDHYMLCTGGQDGILYWDLDPYQGTLEPRKISSEGRQNIQRCVTSLDFSPDRETLYAGTTSGDFIIASIRYMRIVTTIPATRNGIGAIVSIPNWTIIGCGDGTIKFFNSSDNLHQGDIRLESAVTSICKSIDDLEILACTVTGQVYRINANNRQSLVISENHTQSVVSIAFCANDNDRVATASSDGTIRIWDLSDFSVITTATCRREQERGAKPLCLAFSDILLSGWSDGKVLAHSPDGGGSLWFIDNAHIGGVTALTLSHNRRFLLTGGVSGEVRLWELRSRELISHLKEHGQRVTALCLFNDDTMALSASRDRCILRWDLRSEKRVHCHMQRMGGVNGITLSHDEQYVISVGQEKQLTYWNNNATDAIHADYIDDENDEGRCVALSHHGRYLATGGTAGVVRLYDYDSAKCLSVAQGHSSVINSLQFSPDDKQLVSVGDDGCVFIWSIFTRDN